jgi:hypothetical protein
MADNPAHGEFRYSAFENWKYDRVFHEAAGHKPWLDFAQSFYEASRLLIEGVANNELNPDIEGFTGIFLFRHYLELALKRIIIAGRWIKADGENAEGIVPVRRIHGLVELWILILQDAKPKINPYWDNYDTAFVERCVTEFDGMDPQGFAFRYPGQGGENVNVNFVYLSTILEHVHQVLEGLCGCLIEIRGQNEEWQDILNSY